MMTPPAGGYAAAPMAGRARHRRRSRQRLPQGRAHRRRHHRGARHRHRSSPWPSWSTRASTPSTTRSMRRRRSSSAPASARAASTPSTRLRTIWPATGSAAPSSGGFPQVTGTVKNNSSKTSTYTIVVEFKQNGTQFEHRDRDHRLGRTGPDRRLQRHRRGRAGREVHLQDRLDRPVRHLGGHGQLIRARISTPNHQAEHQAARSGRAIRLQDQGPHRCGRAAGPAGDGPAAGGHRRPLAIGSGCQPTFPGGGHERPFDEHHGTRLMRR